MVVTRHGVDTSSPKAEPSSRKSQPTQKPRRHPEGTETRKSSKKRKAPVRREPSEDADEADEQSSPEDFHDSLLLPAFEEAAAALQDIQHLIEGADSTDDDSVLEVPLKTQSPTQTVDIFVTPSTRRETTAEPDGEADATQYFTPQTVKESSRKRGSAQEDGASSTSTAGLSFQTPTRHSKRIRFSSRSPDPELPAADAGEQAASTLVTQPQTVASDQVESDDDAAPEEIGTTAAPADAAAKPRAPKGAQQNAARKKRRERSAAKAQQASASLSASITQQHDDDTASANEQVSHAPLDLNNLPALLPDHILAAPAPSRAGPSADARPRVPAAGSIVVAPPKPVKDVRRGPVAVRVLDSANALLAPRVGKESKNVREGWMKGRAAFAKGKGVGRVERTAFGNRAKAFA